MHVHVTFHVNHLSRALHLTRDTRGHLPEFMSLISPKSTELAIAYFPEAFRTLQKLRNLTSKREIQQQGGQAREMSETEPHRQRRTCLQDKEIEKGKRRSLVRVSPPGQNSLMEL